MKKHPCWVPVVWSLLMLCVLVGCESLRPRTVADVAHEACEMFMAERPEVQQQAKLDGINPLDVARGLCAVNEIVRPFLLANRAAAPEAVLAAQKMGALRQ